MIEFWSADGSNSLYETIDECIQNYLESIDPKSHPKEVTVVGYERTKISQTFLEASVLEFTLDALDEEFGDPNGEHSDPTSKMKEAEMTFIKVILADYFPWTCERSNEFVTVNTQEWLAKNRD